MPSRFLRGLMAHLPDWLVPKKQWGCVVKVRGSVGCSGAWRCLGDPQPA